MLLLTGRRPPERGGGGGSAWRSAWTAARAFVKERGYALEHVGGAMQCAGGLRRSGREEEEKKGQMLGNKSQGHHCRFLAINHRSFLGSIQPCASFLSTSVRHTQKKYHRVAIYGHAITTTTTTSRPLNEANLQMDYRQLSLPIHT